MQPLVFLDSTGVFCYRIVWDFRFYFRLQLQRQGDLALPRDMYGLFWRHRGPLGAIRKRESSTFLLISRSACIASIWKHLINLYNIYFSFSFLFCFLPWTMLHFLWYHHYHFSPFWNANPSTLNKERWYNDHLKRIN